MMDKQAGKKYTEHLQEMLKKKDDSTIVIKQRGLDK